jgi:hypothetical protein
MKLFPRGMGRDQHAVSYDTVKDHMKQYVQKTYRNGPDAAVSIRNLAVMDLTPHEPTRGISRDVDATANLKSQADKDIIYQAELERYIREKGYDGAELDESLCSDLQHLLQQNNAESS